MFVTRSITRKRCGQWGRGLGLAIWWMVVLCSAKGGEIRKTIAIRDGVELSVLYDNSAEIPGRTVECQLENISTKTVAYQEGGGHLQLSFALFDAAGKPIPLEPTWEKGNTPKNDAHGGKLEKEIKAGEVQTYVLPLDEAFGARWESGVRVKVSWEPGYDGSGKLRSIGRGLSAELNLRGAASGAPVAVEAEKAPQRLWVIVLCWGLLIALVVGLTRLIRRKRK